MKKKPVKKSGASTGGKVVSRVNEADSKNKQVPVTSVTPRSTTAKASQKTMTGARKAVAGAAAIATGGAGVAARGAYVGARAASRKEVKTAVSAIQTRAKEIMAANTRLNKPANPKKAFAQAARDYEFKTATARVIPPKPKGK
jgi:hypothetical protein